MERKRQPRANFATFGSFSVVGLLVLGLLSQGCGPELGRAAQSLASPAAAATPSAEAPLVVAAEPVPAAVPADEELPPEAWESAAAPAVAPRPAPVVVAPAKPLVVTVAAPPAAPPAPRPSARLAVRNGTEDPLDLWLDGRRVLRLGSGQSWEAAGLSAGTHGLVASNVERQVQYELRAELAQGALQRWSIEPRWARLKVTNQRNVALRIERDGRSLGTVAPRSSRTLAQVPEGLRELVALGPQGQVVERQRMAFAAGRSLSWVLERPAPAVSLAPPPPPAALLLVNRSGQSLVLSMDGRRMARLADSERRSFPGLQPGLHRFELSIDGAPDQVRSLSLRPGVQERWVVEPVLARLGVENRSGEALELRLGARSLGRLAAGASWDGFVQPGAQRLAAQGLRSGERYPAQTLILRAGQRGRLQVAALFASLTVINDSSEAARFELDGRMQATIPAYGRQQVRGLSLGAHSVRLVGRQSKAELRSSVRLGRDGATLRLSLPGRPAPPVARTERRQDARQARATASAAPRGSQPRAATAAGLRPASKASPVVLSAAARRSAGAAKSSAKSAAEK